MFKAVITVVNPMTGESEVRAFQFNPATMTVAKWTSAYARFEAMFLALQTAAATSEPEKIP